jgi:hypothetical protein
MTVAILNGFLRILSTVLLLYNAAVNAVLTYTVKEYGHNKFRKKFKNTY